MIRKKKIHRKVVFYSHLSSLPVSVKEVMLKRLKEGDLPNEWKNISAKQRKKIEIELRRRKKTLLTEKLAERELGK